MKTLSLRKLDKNGAHQFLLDGVPIGDAFILPELRRRTLLELVQSILSTPDSPVQVDLSFSLSGRL